MTLCECGCGRTTSLAVVSNRSKGWVRGEPLRFMSGHAGRKARLRHGHTARRSPTPEYRSWQHLIERCLNPKDRHWALYGGRGITVCDRWRGSFDAFLADMGLKPSPAHSIDRKENDKGYEPGNCRWATDAEQTRNTRRTRHLTHDGVTLPLTDWAQRLGIGPASLRERLARGWPLERALTTAKGATT